MTDKNVLSFDEERPELFPVYRAARRVRLPTAGQTVVLGLKSVGLDVHFSDEQILHYDLEGRLLRVATPHIQWRRGLSHRTVELRRRKREDGGGFHRRLLTVEEADQVVHAASCRMLDANAALIAGHGTPGASTVRDAASIDDLYQACQRAADFDANAARRDVAEFRRVYGDVPILPPDQYASFALMATDGCRYNHCTFCGFYRDSEYRLKTPDEFRAHIGAAIRYLGRGLALRRGIFLGQANALMGPAKWREQILACVNDAFELPAPDDARHSPAWWQGSLQRFAGITSFLDAFVGTRISAAEFTSLRRQNLRKIFIGMETGDPDLLQWLNKPATPSQILETVKAAKAGGVHVGVIVLVGAGGESYAERHVEHTVKLIRTMGLKRGDFVYLSPLVDAPGSDYAERAAADGIRPLTAERIREQEGLLRLGIDARPTSEGPYVAHYEVANFVY